MPNYNVNTDLPGAKLVKASEPAAVVSSSSLIPMVVLAFNPSNMQSTLDGYQSLASNTNTSQVVIAASPVALSAGQLAGNYAYVTLPTPEARIITSNTSCAQGAPVTLTVAKPFSSAPTSGHTVDVRLWEDFNLPRLFNSPQQVYDTFISRDSVGALVFTGQENVYYSLTELNGKGASLFYVLPVAGESDATNMVANFAPTSNTAFQERMLELAPQPDLIAVPKQPSHSASLSAANWASVDNAWISYINTRANNSAIDDQLRQIIYVAATPNNDVSTAVNYRTSDLNTSNDQVVLCSGQYLVPSLTAGNVQAVSPECAYLGMLNSVSTGVPESYGHAFWGPNVAQLGTNLGLVDRPTPAEQLTFSANGINVLVDKGNQGIYWGAQWTQAKNASSVGANPEEHLHVVITRAKIWGAEQPILAALQAEPNIAATRQKALAQIDALMLQLVQNRIIVDYDLADVTTAADTTSGIARFENGFQSAADIKFVEMKLTARIGG